MSEFSLGRIRIIHTLSIISVGIACITAFISYQLDLRDLVVFHLFTAVPYGITIFLTHRGKLQVPRIIYLFTLNIAIVTTASFVGKYGGIEFMIMFALSLPYIIFSFKKETHYMFSFSLLSILLWILLFTTDFNLITNYKLDKNFAKEIIYPFAMLITLLEVTITLFYYSYLNGQHSTMIHNTKNEALDASNAKSQFLSTMSHEIRTPLNAVIGLSHILGDNNPRKDQVENINALNYSGKILLNLLNNVLDFSKMQSTNIELEQIPTNLELAVKQIKKIHEPNCLKKGITMSLHIDDDIPNIQLDIVRFNQVINNLVTNAIKFTKKGGVSLSIKKINQTDKDVDLRIEVIDSGIGIPADKHDKIWEVFSQASSTTNRLYGGTGLGLPIVKSIVNAMGSDVKIESELGKGSRFYFDVKLNIASKKEVNQVALKKKYNFEGKKVLLVEDNTINVMVAKQILQKEKLSVSVAFDGLQAVKKVKEEKFDIVLMDIQMPVMDGYEATVEIRKFDKLTPIVALSASVFMEVQEKIEECGMNGFIFKPFNPDELLLEIDQIINGTKTKIYS